MHVQVDGVDVAALLIAAGLPGTEKLKFIVECDSPEDRTCKIGGSVVYEGGTLRIARREVIDHALIGPLARFACELG